MDTDNCEWKKVDGVIGALISDTGLVWNEGKQRLYKPEMTKKGYRSLHLMYGAERKRKAVHQLVMEAFVGPRPEGMVVAHLDGNKENNSLSNLIYCTPRENVYQNIIHGKDQPGCKASNAKLSEEQINYILVSDETVKELCEKLNVNKGTIRAIQAGKTHSPHVRRKRLAINALKEIEDALSRNNIQMPGSIKAIRDALLPAPSNF